LREPFLHIIGDLSIIEAAEPVPSKLPVIESSLFVSDHPGRDQDVGLRIFSAKPFDDASQVAPVHGIGKLVQPVEDHQCFAGQKQPLDTTGWRRTLVEAFQLVLKVSGD
jgi:hypothetical protein